MHAQRLIGVAKQCLPLCLIICSDIISSSECDEGVLNSIRSALPMYSERAVNVISERVANVLGLCLFNSIRNALSMYSERVVNTPRTFGARCEFFETIGTAYVR